MNFFFPDRGWLCMAENCTAQHAQPRADPRRPGARRAQLVEVHRRGARHVRRRTPTLSFASHHWPRWGSDDVRSVPRAAARPVPLDARPDDASRQPRRERRSRSPSISNCRRSSATKSHATGYYGHLAHNVKAVYQRYLSWYDGNPANLWKLPPVEVGRRYVALAGGADALLAHAAGVVRRRRLPVGGRAAQPPRVRRPDEREAPRAAGGRARAARLPERVGDVPQRVPVRRARAAARASATATTR